MAYQTGTSLTIDDFVTALKDFALAQGWTIGKFQVTDSGDAGTTPDRLLFLEKGVCHVAFHWEASNTQTAWPVGAGSSFSVNDYQLRGVLGTALNNSKGETDWYVQTGNTITTSETDSDNLTVNNLAGPYTAWYFFSDAGGTYIHAVVQTGDLFTHLSFGVLAQGALTHSGVAYLTGTQNTWWKNSSTTDPANTSLLYNKPEKLRPYPSGAGTDVTNSIGRNNSGMYYAPNALPAGFDTIESYKNRIRKAFAFSNTPTDAIGASPTGMNDIASHHILANSPTWSDYVKLFAVPFIIGNTAGNQACVPGFIPDMRVLNMEGMAPGEEITLVSDTWKVFPQMRQTSWDDVGTVMAPSSGHYAVAIKKIP